MGFIAGLPAWFRQATVLPGLIAPGKNVFTLQTD
jgi:hypothetical protein